VGLHCQRLRTSGSAWTAGVGGPLFGLSAEVGIVDRCRGGIVRFLYAAPWDSVVPVCAKCLLFRRLLRWSRYRRR
jgi:hypothetical protein